MIRILSALVSLLSFRVRSRASLELELIALRHQVIVLRRQRPRRLLCLTDRLFCVWLYRLRPQLLDISVLVKPATATGWHHKGSRLHWRWRSRRRGRSKTNAEVRDLIRRMSSAKPFWGAPRIRGELLKLGVDISQATGGSYLPRRPKTPSPTRRSFLHNHLTDTVAIDMFIVATATFRILSTLMVLDHDRRKIIHFGVTEKPTSLACPADYGGLSLGHRTLVSAPRQLNRASPAPLDSAPARLPPPAPALPRGSRGLLWRGARRQAWLASGLGTAASPRVRSVRSCAVLPAG